MKLPFLHALRTAFPQAHITYLAGSGKTAFTTILAPQVAGLIDAVIEDADIGPAQWSPLSPRPLPNQRFDLVIDTQRRVRATVALRRIRHRIFVSSAVGWLLSDRAPPSGRRKREAVLSQLFALVEAASGQPVVPNPATIAVDAATEAEARRLLPDRDDKRLYVGIAPGAGGRRKRWPLDRFLAVGEHLDAAGYVPVVLLGPDERAWIDQVRARLPRCELPLPEKPSLQLTVAIGRRLAGAIANDSGIGHLLATAAVPLVSLFGPTKAEKFPPLAPRLITIRAQDFGGETMDRIPLDAVEGAILSLLKT
ncbi:MAG TPA: glycosyltransferase family 9 protein [Magnetospirillaceae bacterium]